MIKFYCPSCDKKIGVPPDFAGKKVCCPRCAQPIRVPQELQQEFETEPILDVEDGGTVWTDEMLAGSQAIDAPGTDGIESPPEEITCPACATPAAPGTQFCRQCGNSIQPVATGNPRQSSSPLAGIAALQGLPLAVGAGFAAAMAGALAWVGIAMIADGEYGLVAWALGALVGFVMSRCTDRRGVMIGVLAALLAVTGILTGKLLIAKWCIVPEFAAVFSEIMTVKDENIDEIVADPEAMFEVAARYLAGTGELKQETAELVIGINDGIEIPPERQEEVTAAQEQISNRLETWTADQKWDVAREQMDKVAEQLREFMTESNSGLFMMFIAMFGLWDILWIVFAVASAFRLTYA